MGNKRKAAAARRVSRVLIANRGEIAVRVIRACHVLDIPAVAVYSEADRRSLHVQHADEAVCIGPPAPLQSYLNMDAIIEAARTTGADAIHPGYGFLSENADFAERVEREGLTFIGPPSSAIRAMGSKIGSRAIMKKAGVPIVPGTDTGTNDPAAIVAAVKSMDLPVFIKASAGGGGKGLRLVTERSQIEAAARAAIGEAKSAFGDDTVYVEKMIERPRHVEFQVLADAHGNIVHLFERECSIQRRHQKVLEETPSSALTPELRRRMGEAAVAAARAVGYVNAGTVEFMVDAAGNFYFLEMNTRIQVEHPITECTTGIYLVQWQLRIANGEPLAFAQKDLIQRGHAIECRIYAEDETRHFMPSCGVISYLYEPSGPGIRNDSGVYEGWEVTPHYDPILSKLVAFGEDRDTTRRRMLRALNEYVVHGVSTSIDLHRRILRHPAFIAGDVATTFFDDHPEVLEPASADIPDEAFIAAALADGLNVGRGVAGNGGVSPQPSLWQRLGAWEIGGAR
ncbi:MAG TPA: acetyl-CoA carboxylase biotin carboxylase subunit [Candidatus Krumholzibacteria bacterium]|nr:acetyl-CoA carboxylase biotin carboxylase subunit [Candidatus Krumholzibacteria bacterium]